MIINVCLILLLITAILFLITYFKSKIFKLKCTNEVLEDTIDEITSQAGNIIISNPHIITYEVVENISGIPQTIYTSQSYIECLPSFDESIKHDHKASVDLVIREVETSVPICRVSVLGISIKHTLHQGVYNKDYANTSWHGCEYYSKPIEVFDIKQ